MYNIFRSVLIFMFTESSVKDEMPDSDLYGKRTVKGKGSGVALVAIGGAVA